MGESREVVGCVRSSLPFICACIFVHESLLDLFFRHLGNLSFMFSGSKNLYQFNKDID